MSPEYYPYNIAQSGTPILYSKESNDFSSG
jgi:hypothetical protein